MIYFGDTELYGVKLGNTDISAIYAGDLLIWPTSVTGWSVEPTTIEAEWGGLTENIRITSLSAWTISSSESWVTFSQNSGDSGRSTVIATIANNTSDARTATITVTDGTNVSTISVSQEAYEDYASQYFTMEILTAGTICWTAGSRATVKTIQYSINGGSWTSITATTTGTSFNVSVGDKVRFRGTNATYCQGSSAGTYANTFMNSTAWFNAYGNIMSLIYGDNFQTANTFSATYVFRNFFYTTKMVDASNLVMPATALTQGCYLGAFSSSKIVNSPQLPATSLADSCYFNMFLNASSITQAPELPAPTLVSNCYRSMFYGCTSLNYIKCLATSITAASCLNGWVNGVGSSGTFVRANSSVSWPTGTNGIPSGWTVVNNS